MSPTRHKKRTARFQIAVPEELADRIRKAALKYDRSLNGEIEYRLEQSFGAPITISSIDMGHLIMELMARIQALEAERGDGAYARGEMEPYVKQTAPVPETPHDRAQRFLDDYRKPKKKPNRSEAK